MGSAVKCGCRLGLNVAANFSSVCHDVYVSHGRRGRSPLRVFISLLRKQVRRFGSEFKLPIPLVVAVRVERRSVAALVEMRTGRAVGDFPDGLAEVDVKGKPAPGDDLKGWRVPHAVRSPVVLARFDGEEYLIDGTRRVHHWAAAGIEVVCVYVCEVDCDEVSRKHPKSLHRKASGKLRGKAKRQAGVEGRA